MRGEPASHVYIVEDDAALRSALIFQLKAEGYHASGYDCGEAFLAALPPNGEGCAIIDVHLPGMSGLEVLDRLKSQARPPTVLVVTGQGDVAMAVQAMRAGAMDFIEKPFAKGAITCAVREALNASNNQSRLYRDAQAATARLASLTDRELQVFEGLIAGKLGKQVAVDLGISPRTVEVHRARIMAKMGVRTSAELLRLGLLTETLKIGTAPTGGDAVTS